MAIKHDTLRLNKAISDMGICSRREADRAIEEGRVTINGKAALLGDRVSVTDDVRLDDRRIKFKDDGDAIYLAFNKPKGVTCTTERHVEGNIIDYIGHPRRIFPIGRLDKLSEGLIFLTSDGDIVNKVLRAGNNHEKEYVVTVDKPITIEFLRKMGNGVPILDEVTQKCLVKKESEFVFNITLIQGLNRQIRRMCEYLNYEVKRLKRVRVMNITTKNLKVGEFRNLTRDEVKEIMGQVSKSSKTEEASASVKGYKAGEKRVSRKQNKYI